MQPEKKQKKKIKELFVQDLARIQGGKDRGRPQKCPEYTTMSCREESNECPRC
jgi:hypothetical protein